MESLKFVVLSALSVLVALPAEAGQSHRQNGAPAATCDNDGHCTTFNAAAPIPNYRMHQSRIRNTVGTNRNKSRVLDANGNAVGVVISHKTGAHARVGIAYAARFQAYIDDLETNHGARVLFMNGIRPGRCSSSSEHPCGKALDVCQRRRGVFDPRCNLPGRTVLGQIAASHGLFEGGRWCISDYGHAQIDVTVTACGDRRAGIVRSPRRHRAAIEYRLHPGTHRASRHVR